MADAKGAGTAFRLKRVRDERGSLTVLDCASDLGFSPLTVGWKVCSPGDRSLQFDATGQVCVFPLRGTLQIDLCGAASHLLRCEEADAWKGRSEGLVIRGAEPDAIAAWVSTARHAVGEARELQAFGNGLPFSVARLYFIADVPAGATRAGHAHRELEQVIACASGSTNLHLDDGTACRTQPLSAGAPAAFVPKMTWRRLDGFSPGTICLVVASQAYTPADYIRDHRAFVEEVRGAQQ